MQQTHRSQRENIARKTGRYVLPLRKGSLRCTLAQPPQTHCQSPTGVAGLANSLLACNTHACMLSCLIGLNLCVSLAKKKTKGKDDNWLGRDMVFNPSHTHWHSPPGGTGLANSLLACNMHAYMLWCLHALSLQILFCMLLSCTVTLSFCARICVSAATKLCIKIPLADCNVWNS